MLNFTFNPNPSMFKSNEQQGSTRLCWYEGEIKIKQLGEAEKVNNVKLETGSPAIWEHLFGCQVALVLVRPAVYLTD